MKLITDFMVDVIKKNGAISFKKLWKDVYDNYKDAWKANDPKSLLNDIKKSKAGEVFYLLLSDNRFIRLRNGEWELTERIPAEEIRRLRAEVTARAEDLEEVIK